MVTVAMHRSHRSHRLHLGSVFVGLVALSAMQSIGELRRVLRIVQEAGVDADVLLGSGGRRNLQHRISNIEYREYNIDQREEAEHPSKTSENVTAPEAQVSAATPETEEIQTDVNNTTSFSDQQSILSYTEAALKYQGHTILLVWDRSGRLDLVRMNRTLANSAYPQWWHSGLMEQLLRVRPSETGSIALLLHSDVIEGVDWNILPPIPLLAYSAPLNRTRDENTHLIPSPYEFLGWNDGPIYEARKPNIPFRQRKNQIIWRGEIHGWPSREQSRVKLSEMGKNQANIRWLNATEASYNGANFVSAEEHAQYRYQLDIGGVSGTTWGALRWKMCSGSLVFKVDSHARDWWHEFIQPWVHYIPVKEDLNDLYEKYMWAETNTKGAQIIAQAGEGACLKTSQEDFVLDYLRKVMQNLPPASPRYQNEAIQILDGLLGPNKLVATVSTGEERK